MTFSSFLLILRRQFTHKWGRFLLASGGIMIGIWAITLTSSLSFGLSDTIVKAINSQPAAKEFSLYKTSTDQTEFLQISEAPKLKALSLKETKKLKDKYPEIVDIVPQNYLNLYAINPNNKASCLDLSKQNLNLATIKAQFGQSSESESSSELDPLVKDFNDKCQSITVSGSVFQNFYESNRSSWLGKTTKLERGEIATCFKCGSLDFFKQFNVTEPKDLLNKEIVMEYNQVPPGYIANTIVDVTQSERLIPITKSNKFTLKIVSVIDDRESNTFGSANTNFYIDYSYFTDGIKLAKPDTNIDEIGFIQNSVVIKSYDDLDSIINKLKSDKYLPASFVQATIAGVKTGFLVLTAVLSGFGLIALIASVFGIINVMTISVLERRKEIGILKSLGARDGDIFNLFLIESALLGFIGWLMGTLLSLGFGLIISQVFKSLINGNAEWKANLYTLNIDSFAPTFPWWLLGGTLLLALFFTIISGVFPAINASKQNPVEVLRSE